MAVNNGSKWLPDYRSVMVITVVHHGPPPHASPLLWHRLKGRERISSSGFVGLGAFLGE